MESQKIKQIIGQIEKSISEIEDSLTQAEYKEYCDNAYVLIAYWRKQEYKLKKEKQ